MPAHRFVRTGAASLALALLMLAAPLPRARAAPEATVTCAACGKQVKKDKAIRVIIDGRVYYVCSQACLEKLKKKKK
jgi:TRASH domain-containing protein